MKIFKVDIEMYKHSVIFFNGTIDECAEWVRNNAKRDGNEIAEQILQANVDSFIMSTFSYDGDSIILFNKENSIPIFVHEIVHAVNHLMKRIGIPLTQDTDEAYAYLTEYILEKALPFINENIETSIK